jgi:hypothetical protein
MSVGNIFNPMAKKTGNDNRQLQSAKRNKNDEFYTQMDDIAREVVHYREQLRGKVILCNCDDPRVSNFFRYFFCNFCHLGIKKLIAVCYKNLNPDLFSQNKDEQAVYCIYDGSGRRDDIYPEKNFDAFLRKNNWQRLKGDGDFRSEECIELLKQSDIVITNPPFSLFREYVAQLVEYDKRFLIIGNMNAITYKEFFKFIKEDKLWVGYKNIGTDMRFFVPDHYEDAVTIVDEIEGKKVARSAAIWFTDLEVKKRQEQLTLYKRYNASEYPKYDNYDAIEVSKVADIPIDYDGAMGVPISFVDKYNPQQFEILGQTGVIDPEDILIEYKGGRPYINGKRMYSRILIRRIK